MSRKASSNEFAVSDEAAAYIADVLMDLALEFEANHFGQIRRHYQAMTPEPDEDPRQLDLFPVQAPLGLPSKGRS